MVTIDIEWNYIVQTFKFWLCFLLWFGECVCALPFCCLHFSLLYEINVNWWLNETVNNWRHRWIQWKRMKRKSMDKIGEHFFCRRWTINRKEYYWLSNNFALPKNSSVIYVRRLCFLIFFSESFFYSSTFCNNVES